MDQLEQRQSATEGEIPEEAMKEDKENKLRHVTEDGYYTKVLLDESIKEHFQVSNGPHSNVASRPGSSDVRSCVSRHKTQKLPLPSCGSFRQPLQLMADVKQMLMVKEEAPEDHRSVAELHDPKPQQIKEEEEEICISLGAEQLNGKEETDVTPVKSEGEIQSILLSQNFYDDKIEDRDLPEENDEGESIKIENHEDGSIFSKIEVIVKDEEDDDVKYPASELNHLPDSGLKTKDEDNDWTESRATESDGNIFSEFAEQFLHRHSIQTHKTHSEIRSAAPVHNNKCFTEKKNVDSERKVQAGETFSCEDCANHQQDDDPKRSRKPRKIIQRELRFGNDLNMAFRQQRAPHTHRLPGCRVVFEQRVRELHGDALLVVGILVFGNAVENSSGVVVGHVEQLDDSWDAVVAPHGVLRQLGVLVA
ncbi:hypothetical protein CCH79_00012719 [Gambusia affinis]|uniref:Uncharacterized protein n=1 Tax=Gambusia affinis TaxID=33528 RepID=A0A315V241_GAMAF|nr:hypothetical protein CCH79_00012719 [Gambusia affinis]